MIEGVSWVGEEGEQERRERQHMYINCETRNWK